MAILELQKVFWESKIVYSTATAASDISHLQYMSLLGLWDSKTSPFSSFDSFKRVINWCGSSAMEMLALDLKRRGLYVSRQLCLKDVNYEIYNCELSEEKLEIYDQYAPSKRVLAFQANSGSPTGLSCSP